jgi:hypothetical protein
MPPAFRGRRLTGLAYPRRPDEKADDGSRTRDLELGKLALYQLSYVRIGA